MSIPLEQLIYMLVEEDYYGQRGVKAIGTDLESIKSKAILDTTEGATYSIMKIPFCECFFSESMIYDESLEMEWGHQRPNIDWTSDRERRPKKNDRGGVNYG